MTQTTTAIPVIEVYTSNIERNPRQPRQWFNNEELEQLTISIREHGVIQPLIVAPSSKPDVYILMAGERRLIATFFRFVGTFLCDMVLTKEVDR